METSKNSPRAGERIAKALARAGVASRREVERMIADGRVAIAGIAVETPATVVDTLDGVTVDGTAVAAPEPVRLWRFHKPKGVITTHKDPQGRKTVFDLLPAGIGRVISVGRLDINSEGLLLLTNDGAMARHLEHPSTGLNRRYRVRVHGKVDDARLTRLSEGVTIDGVTYAPITATMERRQGSNAWLIVDLQEGKNREVRKVMAWLGLTVTRLIRIAYGPFGLGQLAPGEMRPISPNDWAAMVAPIRDRLTAGPTARRKARPPGWAKAKPRSKRRPSPRRTGGG